MQVWQPGLWIAALVCVAVVTSLAAGADDRAAVMACQKASDDGDLTRTIAECGNLINEPDVPSADRASALVNRCVAYFYIDAYGSAEEDCTAALAITPNDARALAHRGLSFSARAQYGDAIRDFDRAIELDPRDSNSMISRGYAHFSVGDIDAALADYQRALEVGGNEGRIYYRRAAALLAKGENQRAMDDYARSVPLNTGSAPRFVANALFFLGRYGEAAASYGRIPGSDPYDAFFYYLSLRYAGDDQAALVLEAVESQLDPWSRQLALYFRGQILAADLLKATQDPDPQAAARARCEGAFYIGEMELIAGSKDIARQHFETAVETCPKDFFELTAARAELARM